MLLLTLSIWPGVWDNKRGVYIARAHTPTHILYICDNLLSDLYIFYINPVMNISYMSVNTNSNKVHTLIVIIPRIHTHTLKMYIYIIQCDVFDTDRSERYRDTRLGPISCGHHYVHNTGRCISNSTN